MCGRLKIQDKCGVLRARRSYEYERLAGIRQGGDRKSNPNNSGLISQKDIAKELGDKLPGKYITRNPRYIKALRGVYLCCTYE